mgnify:CR=1 FL=1
MQLDLVRHLVHDFAVGIEELDDLALGFPKRLGAVQKDSPLFREEVGVGLVETDAGVVCGVIRDPHLAFMREILRQIFDLIATGRPSIDIVETLVVERVWCERHFFVSKQWTILADAWVEGLELIEMPHAFVDEEGVADRGTRGGDDGFVARSETDFIFAFHCSRGV